MASSSTAYTLKDAGFFIKNVPSKFDEWELFDVFSEFGLVGYCRIGGQGTDKVSQFGFINMLSVQDADNVRKHLKDGHLIGKNYKLLVTDVKCSQSAPHHQQTSSHSQVGPKNNIPQIKIPSSLLPLNEEVSVDVVDLLPCSSIAENIFTLTVKRTNDLRIEAQYRSMYEQIANFSQFNRFNGEVQIGFDCIFKPAPRIAHRARRISNNQLYLIDQGVIAKYEPTRCYVIPKSFTSLPMRVSMCALDGLTWTQIAVQTFDKIRDVVKQWAEVEKDKMRLICLGFSGQLNLITLFCGKSILVERLAKKGVCDYNPRSSRPPHAYSRNTLLSFRPKESTPKINDDEDVIHDLVRKLHTAVTLKN